MAGGVRNVVADRYQILRNLGTGSLATTYLAVDRFDAAFGGHGDPQAQVVVKVLHPAVAKLYGGGPAVVALFRELASLNHRYLLWITDCGEWNGTAYWVTPYLQKNLWHETQQLRAPLQAAVVCDWLQAAAEGLDYLATRGLAHGALKLTNFLFGPGHRVLLSDYALYRLLYALPIRHREAAGESLAALRKRWLRANAAYVAPEVVTGAMPTRLSDVYSLGVLAYLLLTGVPPYTGMSVDHMLAQRPYAVPPPPSHHARHLGDAVDRVILRALAVTPEQRFGTCVEFVRALRSVTVYGGGQAAAAAVSEPLPVPTTPVVDTTWVRRPRRVTRSQRSPWPWMVVFIGLAAASLVGLRFIQTQLLPVWNQGPRELQPGATEGTIETPSPGHDEEPDVAQPEGDTEDVQEATPRVPPELLEGELRRFDRAMRVLEQPARPGSPLRSVPVCVGRAAAYRWLSVQQMALLFALDDQFDPQGDATWQEIRTNVERIIAGRLPTTSLDAHRWHGRAVGLQNDLAGQVLVEPPEDLPGTARALRTLAEGLNMELEGRLIPADRAGEYKMLVQRAWKEYEVIEPLAITWMHRAVATQRLIVAQLTAAVRASDRPNANQWADRFTEDLEHHCANVRFSTCQLEVLALGETRLWRELVRWVHGR